MPARIARGLAIATRRSGRPAERCARPAPRKRREIDEQHRARRRCIGEALEDQNEFQAEEKSGGEPSHNEVSRLNNEMPRSQHQPATISDATSERSRLHQRRYVVDGEFHRHLLKPQDRQSTTTIAAAIGSSGRVM